MGWGTVRTAIVGLAVLAAGLAVASSESRPDPCAAWTPAEGQQGRDNVGPAERWDVDGGRLAMLFEETPDGLLSPSHICVDDGSTRQGVATGGTPLVIGHAISAATDGTAPTWMGNGHGHEQQLSAVVDGTSLARTSTLHLPGDTRPVATVTQTTTGTPDGITVDTAIEWARPVTVDTAYFGMLPADPRFDTAIFPDGHTFDLAADTGEFLGQRRADSVTLTDGTWDVTVELVDPDEAMGSWEHSSPMFASVQDRETGTTNKVYFARVAPGGTVEVGPSDVWRSSVRYRVSTH